MGKWAAHPDGVEKYVGSDIAFGSLEHLVERMASESCPNLFELHCPAVMVRLICTIFIVVFELLSLFVKLLPSLRRIDGQRWKGKLAEGSSEAF